jgi:hypothetical protein
MTIVPDTKNWTWVINSACPECGFDASSIAASEVPRLLRDNANKWQSVLIKRADVRDRPRDDVWSPLEYGCHVRDVCRVFVQRVRLMLAEDDPQFPNWDQNATAERDRYGEQNPPVVAAELAEAAETMASELKQVSASQWQRTGTRSDGITFTVDSLARYFIHDPVHHLYDVTGIRH